MSHTTSRNRRDTLFLNKGYDPVLPQIRALDMPDADPDQEHWLSKLQAIRKDLEQRILEQQNSIQQHIKEQEAYQYQRNQLVLVRRTAKELQEAHTKLTDKYDHLTRVNRVFANQTTYEITYLYLGERDHINRRNLRPFYEDFEDDDDPFKPPRFPALSLAIPEKK